MLNMYFAILKNDVMGFLNSAKSIYSSPAHWRKSEWVFFTCCLLFLVLTFFVDQIVRSEIVLLHGQYQDQIFSFGHWYGQGTATLWLFVIFYLWGLVAQRGPFRFTSLLIGEAYLFSGVLTISLKSLLGRWRPHTDHGSFAFLPFTAGPNEHLSFPSGHVTVAFALSSVMAGLHSNRIWKSCWYLLALITAISRIYHDNHWLSDVVCSALIGTAVGIWITKNHLSGNIITNIAHE